MKNFNRLICRKKSTLKEIYKIFNEAVLYDYPSGIAVVKNENNEIIGTITDGDIRRAIIKFNRIELTANDCMNPNPILFKADDDYERILNEIPIQLKQRNRKSKKFLKHIILVNKKNELIKIIGFNELIEQKIALHRHIVVVGLGYVGLTMAAVIADSGFNVTGFDIDKNKIQTLMQGNCYIHERGLPEIINKNLNKSLFVSNLLPENGDVYFITVGTPVKENKIGEKNLEMKYIDDAAIKVGSVLKRGNLVVLRSTVPIGTSRNYVLKKLEKTSGLKCGKDFHLAFAPERTAEGKALYELRNLPQIIGGFNKDSLEATSAIFRDITPTIVKVNSLEAAEMAKLINNTFRDYIFAYSNQLAKIAYNFNIDISGVIKAANEGYIRDPVPLPSPGVGGPCLTKDPYIFASMSSQYNFDPSIFINGRRINESMHNHVVLSLLKQISQLNKNPKDCKILICGIAFKGQPETGDVRNSSAVEIAHLLKEYSNKIYGFDPVANKDDINNEGIKFIDLDAGFKNSDVVLFLNNHLDLSKINLSKMMKLTASNPIIYDGWNLFRYSDVINSRPSIYMNLSITKSSIK